MDVENPNASFKSEASMSKKVHVCFDLASMVHVVSCISEKLVDTY